MHERFLLGVRRQRAGLQAACAGVHLRGGGGVAEGDRAVRHQQDAALGLHVDWLTDMKELPRSARSARQWFHVASAGATWPGDWVTAGTGTERGSKTHGSSTQLPAAAVQVQQLRALCVSGCTRQAAHHGHVGS